MKFLKIIDLYIIKKFLGTYFLFLLMIIAIVVMFDFNEKVGRFMEHDAPAHAIIFDYYLNFVPYMINLFSPLFVFISVIFFTSKLADNSEIIAMLSSGINIRRLMRPYMITASLIAGMTLYLSAYVIPPANVKQIEFKNKYVKNKQVSYSSHIQLEVDTGAIAFFDHFDLDLKSGNRFSLEKFDGKKLQSRLTAQKIVWDTLYHWTIKDYMIRNFAGMREEVVTGESLDTMLAIMPTDFLISEDDWERMKTPELRRFIARQKQRGFGNVQRFEVEYHKRFALTFATFVLTFIGVSISSRKIKGGMGVNLGLGLMLGFGYILFLQITGVFAASDLVSPFVAVWIPNIVYLFIAAWLYKKAPR